MILKSQIEEVSKLDDWITVILGHRKRGYNLIEQWNAIQNQTIKPKEVIIVKNEKHFEIPKEIAEQAIVVETNNNLWVRFRFTVALMAKTKYICMFDDDTMPGSMWLENCLNESKKQRGLYGTIGCLYGMAKPDRARNWGEKKEWLEHYYSHIRFGWANPNEKTVMVDIVWHAWFFDRDMLTEAYFREPLLPQYRMCWEDMHFSYAIQKYLWLSTFVPPHPKDNKEMRGSQKGWELWTRDSSWAMIWKWDNDPYDLYHQMLRIQGFKSVIEIFDANNGI